MSVEQNAAPGGEVEPGVHASHDVAPVKAAANPTLHGVHVDEPDDGANDPAEQVLHDEAVEPPSMLNEPEGQGKVQAEEEVDPAKEDKPAGQVVHASAVPPRVGLYAFAGHL